MHLFKKSILLISLFSLVFTAEKVAVTAEGNTNDGRNCAEGQTADDGMLAGMMTYVKGVEGDIPK